MEDEEVGEAAALPASQAIVEQNDDEEEEELEPAVVVPNEEHAHGAAAVALAVAVAVVVPNEEDAAAQADPAIVQGIGPGIAAAAAVHAVHQVPHLTFFLANWIFWTFALVVVLLTFSPAWKFLARRSHVTPPGPSLPAEEHAQLPSKALVATSPVQSERAAWPGTGVVEETYRDMAKVAFFTVEEEEHTLTNIIDETMKLMAEVEGCLKWWVEEWEEEWI
jgi:hypothetical protein